MGGILISAKKSFEHMENPIAVLKILKACGLRYKEEKCKFVPEEITYLGFTINKDGILPNPEKIRHLLRADIPKNVTQHKSVLRMLKYYHRHLLNLLKPLDKLRKKNTRWDWGISKQKHVKN